MWKGWSVDNVQVGTETDKMGQRPYTLTGRQEQIAGLVAEGLAQREIANQLDISPRTVASHIATMA